MILIDYTHKLLDMTGKEIKSVILKYSWNVERLIEHVGQNMAWELS